MLFKSICHLFLFITFWSCSSAPIKHIITGPPGSGKTTLTMGLEVYHGFDVIHEAAADIIALELAAGIEAPWDDPDFDAKILALQTKRLTQTNTSETPILCDRSPIDIYAYAEFHNTPLPVAIDRHITAMLEDPTISKTVLFVENLGSVHKTAIRRETLEEAKNIEALLYKYYTLFGFTIVRIPALPFKDRINFVLSLLN